MVHIRQRSLRHGCRYIKIIIMLTCYLTCSCSNALFTNAASSSSDQQTRRQFPNEFWHPSFSSNFHLSPTFRESFYAASEETLSPIFVTSQKSFISDLKSNSDEVDLPQSTLKLFELPLEQIPSRPTRTFVRSTTTATSHFRETTFTPPPIRRRKTYTEPPRGSTKGLSEHNVPKALKVPIAAYNYSHYYGNPVVVNQDDEKLWEILPIQLPDDLVGDAEGTSFELPLEIQPAIAPEFRSEPLTANMKYSTPPQEPSTSFIKNVNFENTIKSGDKNITMGNEYSEYDEYPIIELKEMNPIWDYSEANVEDYSEADTNPLLEYNGQHSLPSKVMDKQRVSSSNKMDTGFIKPSTSKWMTSQELYFPYVISQIKTDSKRITTHPTRFWPESTRPENNDVENISKHPNHRYPGNGDFEDFFHKKPPWTDKKYITNLEAPIIDLKKNEYENMKPFDEDFKLTRDWDERHRGRTETQKDWDEMYHGRTETPRDWDEMHRGRTEVQKDWDEVHHSRTETPRNWDNVHNVRTETPRQLISTTENREIENAYFTRSAVVTTAVLSPIWTPTEPSWPQSIMDIINKQQEPAVVTRKKSNKRTKPTTVSTATSSEPSTENPSLIENNINRLNNSFTFVQMKNEEIKTSKFTDSDNFYSNFGHFEDLVFQKFLNETETPKLNPNTTKETVIVNHHYYFLPSKKNKLPLLPLNGEDLIQIGPNHPALRNHHGLIQKEINSQFNATEMEARFPDKLMPKPFHGNKIQPFIPTTYPTKSPTAGVQPLKFFSDTFPSRFPPIIQTKIPTLQYSNVKPANYSQNYSPPATQGQGYNQKPSYDTENDSEEEEDIFADLTSLSALLIIPGGLIVVALALALFYFNFIWYPTPVVTARLADMIRESDPYRTLDASQQRAIGEVYNVFRGLEEHYMMDQLWSSICRSRLVCQVHQVIPDLWSVTQASASVVRKNLAAGPDGAETISEYLSAALDGSLGKNCMTEYSSCTAQEVPVKSILQNLFSMGGVAKAVSSS